MSYTHRLMNAARRPTTPVYPRSVLASDRDAKRLSCDVSDLTASPHPFERLWPYACDVGLRISAADGGYATFYLDHQETREGDVIAWYLKPSLDTVRRYSALEGWVLVIWND